MIDDESDRLYEYGFTGMRIKAHYHNGWFIGKIAYYNSKLNEYKVLYDDMLPDFIRPDEIDGIEIMLLS